MTNAQRKKVARIEASESFFKWRHFQADIILLCVRWYLRYSLSYRDLEEMVANADYRLITVRLPDGWWRMRVGWSNTSDSTSSLATIHGGLMRHTSQ